MNLFVIEELVSFNMSNIPQTKFFKIIEWILYLGLCGISAFFLEEVLVKFFAGKTSFTQSEKPISELPTITLCFSKPDSRKIEYEHGIDFKIKYKFYEGWKEHKITLKEGKQKKISGEIVKLEKVFTLNYGSCYIITSLLSKEYVIKDYVVISLKFNKSIIDEDLPTLNAYITSEKNAHGIIRSLWKNGKVIKIHIEKGMSKKIDLITEQYNYLTTNSKCSEESFYECAGRYLEANLTSKTKCTLFSLPTLPSMPICKTVEEMIEFWIIWNNINFDDLCSKLCINLEYSGEESYYRKSWGNRKNGYRHNTHLSYGFSSNSTTVYEEYLVYDIVSMIGSVGGTLGMCIGFSFTGMISFVIDFIENGIRIVEGKLTKQKLSKGKSWNGHWNEIKIKSSFERSIISKVKEPIYLKIKTYHEDKQILEERITEITSKLRELENHT